MRQAAGGDAAPARALDDVFMRAVPAATVPDELAFLETRHADRQTLERAAGLARRWRVSPEQALFSSGLVTPGVYYRALAARTGLPFFRMPEDGLDMRAVRHPRGRAMTSAGIVPLASAAGEAGFTVALAPRARALRRIIALGHRPDAARLLGARMRLTAPEDIAAAVAHGFSRTFLARAVAGLSRQAPRHSAAGGVTRGQKRVLGGLATILLAGVVFAPWAAFVGVSACLGLVFAAVGASRLLACAMAMRGTPERTRALPGRIPDRALPVYTLLVPLYREAAVLPHLAAALMRLDYPCARLDIKFILEADDRETIAAVDAARLPAQFHVVVVPPAEPRTKPKALNYALSLARGQLVAVYDAEDRPDPGQLRAAVAAFAAGPDNLACVQARLGFYNARRNWLTRQFAIEYAGLFDALLPALDALGLPIPLGGTSNHFRGILALLHQP